MADRPRHVAWAPSAQEALDEVLAFIAEDSPDAAARVLDVVLDAAQSLSVFCHRGRVVPEIGDQNVREIFVYSYRLMYEIAADIVQVIAFVHGARDFGSLLKAGHLTS